jgi:hypothetical protein
MISIVPKLPVDVHGLVKELPRRGTSIEQIHIQIKGQ